MKPQNLQRLLKSQSEVLSRLYADIAKLRAERFKFNALADDMANSAIMGEHSDDMLAVTCRHENSFREQAALFTPYINKLKKRIAGLEECQKELKGLLKVSQSLEAWERDDTLWMEAN